MIEVEPSACGVPRERMIAGSVSHASEAPVLPKLSSSALTRSRSMPLVVSHAPAAVVTTFLVDAAAPTARQARMIEQDLMVDAEVEQIGRAHV